MAMISADNFLDDLKAGILFGQPIEVGDAETRAQSNLLTCKQIDRLKSDSLRDVDWPPRLLAARKYCEQTGLVSGVFRPLSVRLDSQRWVDRVLRRTVWYLLLLIVTMVLGLVFFFYYSNPVYEDLRSDLRYLSAAHYVPQTDPVAWMMPTLVVAIVLGAIGLLWSVTGGPRRTVWWLGGRTVANWRQTSVALNAIEDLNQAGMPMEEAIDLSCDLVAAGDGARDTIKSALSGAKESTGVAAWADAMTAAARERMANIEIWLPLVTTTLIGGVLATVYCVLIYRPIISILHELSSAWGGM